MKSASIVHAFALLMGVAVSGWATAQPQSLPESRRDVDDCTIMNTYTKSHFFREGSVEAFQYDAVKNDSINSHILLVTSYGQVRGIEMLHLIVDSVSSGNVKFTRKDFSVLSRRINLSDQSLVNFFETNEPEGFYFGTCKHHIDHVTQTLVISNPKKDKWIEVTAMDIYLKDLLEMNKGFESLKNIVEMLQYLNPHF
ncbi:hypothetical protein LZZ85_13330 [Terrimonas sp. NA20]|uniref:Uncharacterized protein n=1 Tax=Terrimonas ginsenosidimutans TaxID=2908004 RepID=A0ABS9KSH0_9BACT|nr:hypothetical protein [Terrimonas ginsenosidimutans]MCG2615275.1 hypothetical protein [Terrimonas ginsenosidimutans]